MLVIVWKLDFNMTDNEVSVTWRVACHSQGHVHPIENMLQVFIAFHTRAVVRSMNKLIIER